MRDKMRWRYGDTNPGGGGRGGRNGDRDRRPALAGRQQCQAGRDAGRTTAARPPTRQAFVAEFLGVAMTRSRAGDTAPVRVATTGVFELDCIERHVRAGRPGGRGRDRRRQRAVESAGGQSGRKPLCHRPRRQAATDRHRLRAGRYPLDRDDRRRARAAVPAAASASI